MSAKIKDIKCGRCGKIHLQNVLCEDIILPRSKRKTSIKIKSGQVTEEVIKEGVYR
jgi:hypothetical protein